MQFPVNVFVITDDLSVVVVVVDIFVVEDIDSGPSENGIGDANKGIGDAIPVGEKVAEAGSTVVEAVTAATAVATP